MAKVNHQELRRLVGIIDEEGTRLTRAEIDYIANIIDTKQTEFDDRDDTRIRRIHDKRVVNGKPDYDDL